MKSTTRKHIWPVSLVMAIAVVGMLAALVALSGGFDRPPGAQAQPAVPFSTSTPLPQTPTPVPQAPMAVIPSSSEQVEMGDDITVNVGAYFTDADSAALTYTAVSTNTGAATVAVTGSMVTITGVATGTSTVVVTATDGDMLSARHTISVMVIAPVPTAVPTRAPQTSVDMDDDIVKDSTSAGAGIKITLTIGNLPASPSMRAGSSVVLYLEDDFQVPDSIARDTVYFTVTNPDRVVNGQGGRVYVTDPIELDEDDYYGGDDDSSIRVYLPDFNTGDDYDGFQGPDARQTLTMVITDAAGIKNPTEAHDNDNNYQNGYKAGYDLLGVGEDIEGTPPSANNVDDLIVQAKISLSDEDNTRGYELTVTGSGFNNGTSAAVHVLADPDTTMDLANLTRDGASPLEQAQACREILQRGHRAGIATVGSDDKAAVSFDVTVPVFKPGNVNYLCMVDGEGRSSVRDVETFKLEPSIRVSPASANAGDKVNVFAQDFTGRDGLQCLKIASQPVYAASSNDADCTVEPGDEVSVNTDSIGPDGSAAISFDLPGSVSGSALEGTVRIDATWGSTTEDAKVTVSGSVLRLSQAEVRANESITIQGDGFGDEYIDAANITIDGVALLVDEDSKNNADRVTVSNAGQFVVTVAVWPASSSDDTNNPALISGTHTIRVEDKDGFFGTASLIIKEPAMTITPDVLGPRDYITITGSDWPVDNSDGGSNTNVAVTIDDDSRTDRLYSVIPDATGRFVVEHRVSRDVGIPSTNQVRATYGDGDIVKVASFEVPAATISVTPTQGQPGDEVSLTVEGMKVYAEVAAITIGGADIRGARSFRTDRDGAVTADGLVIPGLDPGTYSVEMKVGSEGEQTVAIGSIEVLQEVVAGAEAALPAALTELGDNLVAVFYFDNVSKEWSFFDPRPEFAELNTLDGLVAGQAYWVLVGEAVEEVVLNGKTRSLTCSNGDCWNLEVW